MSRESKEIREILNDIDQIITEGYVFGKESNEIIPENDEIGEDFNDISSTTSSQIGKPQNKNIDAEVKEMRKIALSVIGNLTPMEDPEAYKLVKSVWDSCDKFLTKDTKDVKQPQNQNNIN